MARLFFEDSNIEAYLSIGDEKAPIVVTFSEMGVQAGQGAWGGAMLEKLNYSYVGFVSKRPNWFPRVSVERAYALVVPEFRRNRTVITYGHSQGGFAALKYSGLFKANLALAFSPQYSICPTSMSGKDQRFTNFYVKACHERHDIIAGDIAPNANVFAFFDPSDQFDKLNAQHIAHAVPQARLIKIFGTGHSSIRPFASSQAFQLLVDLGMKGDIPGIKRLERDVKRRWPQRRSYLARATVFSRPAWCKKLLADVGDLAPETCGEILNGLVTGGDVEFVNRYADTLWLSSNRKTRPVILEALLATGDVANVVDRCARWLIENPEDAQIYDFLCRQVALLPARDPAAVRAGDLFRLGTGWYPAEAWGAWSLSLRARVFVNLAKVPAGKMEIRIPIRYLSVERQKISIRCWQNEQEYPARVNGDFAILDARKAQGNLTVDFEVDRLLSPAACNLSADSRLLGLGIKHEAEWQFA